MGILNKKEKKVKRPMQEVGRENSVTWYQDTNEITINSKILVEFIHQFNMYGLHLPKDKIPLNYLGNGSEHASYDLESVAKNIYLLNYPNLFEYLLVYLELPEPVEELFIAKYKEFKRQIALIQDKINQKRKKLL